MDMSRDDGLTKLVPWFWISALGMVTTFFMLLIPWVRKDYSLLPWVCAVAFFSIWVEKGMGLMIPGSIPTPIGEFTEYTPSAIEIMNSLGNWAIGFLVLTMLLKGAIGILTGEVRLANRQQASATDVALDNKGYADA